MSIDNNITNSIEEKIKEVNETDQISKILINWLNEIDNGKKDILMHDLRFVIIIVTNVVKNNITSTLGDGFKY